MNNWMQKYEKEKDDSRERELNFKLTKLLDLLDQTSKIEERLKIILKIIDIYDDLRIEACNFNETDYNSKKKEADRIRYEIKQKDHIESGDSESWNEYREEELLEEEDYER